MISLSNVVPVPVRAYLEVAWAYSPSLSRSVPICAMRGSRLGQVQGSFQLEGLLPINVIFSAKSPQGVLGVSLLRVRSGWFHSDT